MAPHKKQLAGRISWSQGPSSPAVGASNAVVPSFSRPLVIVPRGWLACHPAELRTIATFDFELIEASGHLDPEMVNAILLLAAPKRASVDSGMLPHVAEPNRTLGSESSALASCRGLVGMSSESSLVPRVCRKAVLRGGLAS